MNGGTPPQLWKTLTTGTSSVMWRGLLRDQVRIARLCRQVEKLNWMLEYMDGEPTDVFYTGRGPSIEEAEAAWLG